MNELHIKLVFQKSLYKQEKADDIYLSWLELCFLWDCLQT